MSGFLLFQKVNDFAGFLLKKQGFIDSKSLFAVTFRQIFATVYFLEHKFNGFHPLSMRSQKLDHIFRVYLLKVLSYFVGFLDFSSHNLHKFLKLLDFQ